MEIVNSLHRCDLVVVSLSRFSGRPPNSPKRRFPNLASQISHTHRDFYFQFHISPTIITSSQQDRTMAHETQRMPLNQEELRAAVLREPGVLEVLMKTSQFIEDTYAASVGRLKGDEAKVDEQLSTCCAHREGESDEMRTLKDHMSALSRIGRISKPKRRKRAPTSRTLSRRMRI